MIVIPPDRAIPKSTYSTTSEQITTKTVPAKKRWKVWSAWSYNGNRATVHEIRYQDSSNQVIGLGAKAASGQYADWDYFIPVVLGAGMKVQIYTATFTAGDTINRGLVYQEWDA